MNIRIVLWGIAALALGYGSALNAAYADPPVTWFFDEETSGEDVAWVSETPVRANATLFENSYEITEVWVFVRWLIFTSWENVTDQVPPEVLAAAGRKVGPAPVDLGTVSMLYPEPPEPITIAADMSTGIDAAGYAWADISNVTLGTAVIEGLGEVDILTLRLVGQLTIKARNQYLCDEDLVLPTAVEQQDLNAVLNRWGDLECLPGGLDYPCLEDIAAPDGVEMQDLNAVLNRWGDPICQ